VSYSIKVKTMRYNIFIFITVALIGIVSALPAQKTSASSVDFNVGLNLSLNSANVEMGEDKTENSLVYNFAALELDIDVLDNLTLGILAGLNSNYFSDPVDFFHFPIGLRFNKEKNNSMVLGINAKTELLLPGDFSLQARGEFIYFKLHKNSFEFDVPDVNGEYSAKNEFFQSTVELLIQYDGLSNFTLYAGPQLFILNGKYSAAETTDTIDVSDSYKYNQRRTIGITGGINFDLADHFTVDARLSIISKTSLSAGIFYVF
jgi:hypothetical protein